MKKIVSLLFISVFFLTSCFDDPGTDIVWDEAFVELDAATTSSGRRDFTFLRLNNGATPNAGFTVLRAAKDASRDIVVNFQIETSSTAIAGVHYTATGTSVTIPAQSWSAVLPITISPDNIEAGEILTIVITLTGADIPVNPLTATGTHRVQISCPPNIPTGGTWTGVTTGGAFGEFGNNPSVTISPVTGNNTRYDITDATASFFVAFGGTATPGQFDNVCDAITLLSTGTDFGPVNTDAANGAPQGTWNPTTETLTIPWYNALNDFAEVSVFTTN